MKLKKLLLLLLLPAVSMSVCQACLWDSTTLPEEKKRHPELAKVVLGEMPPAEDSRLLRERIQKLKGERRESEPMWWNDLAVAHIKLGELKEAAGLLESVTNRFANDYGIHANLGTAYHLMGRYQEAEREIARDLEINPDAHFGLERYHLALLKYLNKDKEYQKEHVYVDGWSNAFVDQPNLTWLSRESGPYSSKRSPEMTIEGVIEALQNNTNAYADDEKIFQELKGRVDDPEFRFQWGLFKDARFEEGVTYMASLNQKEPACFVMLGIMCLMEKDDYHLAAASFQKSIDLGSPQKEVLRRRILAIEKFKKESRNERSGMVAVGSVFGFLCIGIPAIGIGYMVFKDVRSWRRSRGNL